MDQFLLFICVYISQLKNMVHIFLIDSDIISINYIVIILKKSLHEMLVN